MKLEIGKSYKTRAGNRAVVVAKKDDSFRVWHDDTEHTWGHEENGEYSTTSKGGHDRDLMEEWREPRKGTVWVNVYDNGLVRAHDSLKKTNERANGRSVNNFNVFEINLDPEFIAEGTCIACVKVEWEEGQYDD